MPSAVTRRGIRAKPLGFHSKAIGKPLGFSFLESEARAGCPTQPAPKAGAPGPLPGLQPYGSWIPDFYGDKTSYSWARR